MITLAVLNSYTIGAIIASAVISFGLGLLFKMGIITKQKKRILRLEDEMLSNHSTILDLEKNLAEFRKQSDDLKSLNKKESNLKVS